MARIRIFIVLALALTAGGVLAFATYNYVASQGARPVAEGMATRHVVVAAADLAVGAELTADSLRTIDWPASSVPEGAMDDPKEVVGRGLILPVIKNEPILPMKLASKEAGSGLPPAIPPGLRAVSVRVNEVIGVAGYVLPGTRVDVVATLNPSSQTADMTSKIVLTDVLVLAAGTKLEQPNDKEKPIAVSVVTLLVDPDEAERLTLASSEGKIQLALRNPLDRARPVTRGVRPAWLIGAAPPVRQVSTRRTGSASASASLTSAPPTVAAASTVEIIRGDKRAHEVVRGQE
jgi:pilus assembly protein CpaB